MSWNRWNSLRLLLWVAASGLATLLGSPPASAQAPVPVPRTTLIPVAPGSYPFGAADHLNVPEDLGRVGYVEEEFLVSGTANVYDWPAPGTATVRAADAPYTTRMLVRRPARRERLSGNVIVEILNASNLVDLEIGWALSKDLIVRRGDVWIGFTAKPVTAAALRTFNPVRYAALSWANPVPLDDPRNCTSLVTIIGGDSSRATENGLIYDIFSQIAAWARSEPSLRPRHRAQRVYGYGYSQSGFNLQTYIGAVHPLARQADGRPIFDGFLDATGFNSPAPINQCTRAPSGAGAGQIRNAGVPVIRMASNSEALLGSVQAGRRADSDDPADRFREYEAAGTGHASPDELDFGPAFADILAAGAPMPPLTCGSGPRSPLTLGIFQNAALVNLDLWVRLDLPPPPGALIDFDAGAPVLDDLGNPTGGVRSPYLDVPTAQWFVGSSGPGLCFLLGFVRPLDAAQLTALYPRHRRYVDQVIISTLGLVIHRYLTLEDGLEIIAHARASGVPAAADIPSDIPDDLP
jgi:hypothetical protein